MKHLLLEHISSGLPGRTLFPFLPYILGPQPEARFEHHTQDFGICLSWMEYFRLKHTPFLILFEAEPEQKIMPGGGLPKPHFQLWKELIEWEGNIETMVYEELCELLSEETPLLETFDEFWERVPECYVESGLNRVRRRDK